ncbi:putative lipid II flippase FtsW [Mycobacteroides saopaulense]|uniref:Probable peptidoglycan glycosyltransferase FtsW n=1 Tax=Mycobacteroides saopaulense TaxID=1578165 RepID=A0A1S4VS85_9MYCO|nr:putative lipid II flippase FtsW [Mycobacteroides saopaulense]ALR11543.1 cell division protein FtsW [Mycobacteroides saopaulense]ORB59928.1 putative lipid II flippase FtsW [Mycobacteroides saopaulense]
MSTLTAPFARIFRSEKSADTKTPAKAAKKSSDTKGDGLVARTRLGAWLNRPMTSFHLIVAVAALLTTLGLIMVLSASGVESYDVDGSAWTVFGKQVLWVCVGLVGFYIALRTPIRVMRKYSFPAFVFTIVLITLVLVPGIGTYSNGSRGWFVYGGMSMQPSELTKIAFAIWGAHLLASRRMEKATLREMLVPLVPAALLALILIVIQPDLGQTVSLSIILLALLWYAGLPLKVFLSSVVAAVLAAAILAVSAGYRSDRVKAWLDPSADPQATGYQSRQARFALAQGGFFGQGLGQGSAKWHYLPNAHNDFIFAIIGEELGFVGCLGVLALFGVFAYTAMRIAKRSADPFLRMLTATAGMWVIGQSFINIGYVIGLLPVTGIQLPLISSGGTATATALFMIGLIANAARHEPEAVAALRAGTGDRMNRLLRLPAPEPYVPPRIDSARDRLRAKSAAQSAAAAKPQPERKRQPEPAQAPKRKPRARTESDAGHHRQVQQVRRASGTRASGRSREQSRAGSSRARTHR